jgi:hypothetical protein
MKIIGKALNYKYEIWCSSVFLIGSLSGNCLNHLLYSSITFCFDNIMHLWIMFASQNKEWLFPKLIFVTEMWCVFLEAGTDSLAEISDTRRLWSSWPVSALVVLETTNKLTETVYKVLGLRLTRFSVDISPFLTSDTVNIILAIVQIMSVFSSWPLMGQQQKETPSNGCCHL